MTSRSTMLANQLKQTAVYWGNPQSDGYGGRTFDDAVELDVRWQDRQELFVDAQGREQISRAVAYVATDLDIGGYLYLGELADLSSAEEGDPLSVSTAYEIRAISKTPDIGADRFARKVWL
ncbi:MAG: hypothetical protein KAT58_12990 [candidate division Zixibacteria bacterium]|nr:hypothetical protein [candidate division Zixibacteria bacterium]